MEDISLVTPFSHTDYTIHLVRRIICGLSEQIRKYSQSDRYYVTIVTNAPTILTKSTKIDPKFPNSPYIPGTKSYSWQALLGNTDTLVVCGYSFGDKAQLILWCDAERSRSLVAVDRRGTQKIIESARNTANRILERSSVQFVTKPIEDVDPDELLGLLVST